MKKLYCLFVVSIIHFLTLILFIISRKCGNEDEKIFEEEESLAILKIICLMENI